MFWRKPKPLPEKSKDELFIESLLVTYNLFNLEDMIKEADSNKDIKDKEQIEFILKLIKPELEKSIKEGYASGSIKDLELDYIKYRIPSKYSTILTEKGISLELVDNSIWEYAGYPHRQIIKEATGLILRFVIFKPRKVIK